MAEEGTAATAGIALAESPVAAPEVHDAAPASPSAVAHDEKPASEKKRKRKDKDEDLEYEVEFDTPFGKLEFEFEPAESKERKERERREKAERAVAKAAAKAAKKAAKQRKKSAEETIERAAGRRSALPVLIVIGLALVAIAVAFWLFARPGPEEQDIVPEEFRNPEAEPEPAPAPRGFTARVRSAIRAGRQASREAQREQEQRFRDLTRGK